jgi:Transposase and inactivated derivatives, IS30 family
MGQHYSQLSLRERVTVELLHREGLSVRSIAARLERSASTISRELRRNAKPTKQWSGPYDGERAHGLAARRRRWDTRFKLARQPDLAADVKQRLAMGLSPEQIAGRLAREQGRTIISHESIYRFIYHRARQPDPSWYRLLPRHKHRRGHFAGSGGSLSRLIKHRISIAERPAEVATRQAPGHWEADLMLFGKANRALLVLHERRSRYTVVERIADKTADGVAGKLVTFFAALPQPLRASVTFDNGGEFARHHRLAEELSLPTYFCDPHRPWQKGGVENAIGRMRRYLPSTTDLQAIPTDGVEIVMRPIQRQPEKDPWLQDTR